MTLLAQRLIENLPIGLEPLGIVYWPQSSGSATIPGLSILRRIIV